MDDQEAVTLLIKQAIAAPDGKLRLAIVEGYLVGELKRNRFNMERAIAS